MWSLLRVVTNEVSRGWARPWGTLSGGWWAGAHSTPAGCWLGREAGARPALGSGWGWGSPGGVCRGCRYRRPPRSARLTWAGCALLLTDTLHRAGGVGHASLTFGLRDRTPLPTRSLTLRLLLGVQAQGQLGSPRGLPDIKWSSLERSRWGGISGVSGHEGHPVPLWAWVGVPGESSGGPTVGEHVARGWTSLFSPRHTPGAHCFHQNILNSCQGSSAVRPAARPPASRPSATASLSGGPPTTCTPASGLLGGSGPRASAVSQAGRPRGCGSATAPLRACTSSAAGWLLQHPPRAGPCARSPRRGHLVVTVTVMNTTTCRASRRLGEGGPRAAAGAQARWLLLPPQRSPPCPWPPVPGPAHGTSAGLPCPSLLAHHPQSRGAAPVPAESPLGKAFLKLLGSCNLVYSPGQGGPQGSATHPVRHLPSVLPPTLTPAAGHALPNCLRLRGCPPQLWAVGGLSHPTLRWENRGSECLCPRSHSAQGSPASVRGSDTLCQTQRTGLVGRPGRVHSAGQHPTPHPGPWPAPGPGVGASGPAGGCCWGPLGSGLERALGTKLREEKPTTLAIWTT